MTNFQEQKRSFITLSLFPPRVPWHLWLRRCLHMRSISALADADRARGTPHSSNVHWRNCSLLCYVSSYQLSERVFVFQQKSKFVRHSTVLDYNARFAANLFLNCDKLVWMLMNLESDCEPRLTIIYYEIIHNNWLSGWITNLRVTNSLVIRRSLASSKNPTSMHTSLCDLSPRIKDICGCHFHHGDHRTGK